MKKRIIFVICLLLLVFTINVNAADNQIVLNPSQTNISSGDTVTINLKVNCVNSFEGLTGTLQYDKTKLTLMSIQNASGVKDMNDTDAEGNYIITIFADSNSDIITSGTCQSLTFKVLDGVTNGETISILLKNVSLKDGDEKIENLSTSTALTVKTEAIPDQNTESNNEPNTNNTPEDLNTNNQSKENDDKQNSNNLNQNKHNNTNGATNNTGNDTTQASKDVNYTGAEDYAVIIGIIAVIGLVSFIKYRQYKNI